MGCQQIAMLLKLPCNQLICRYIYMLDSKSLKFYSSLTIMRE